MGACDCNAGWFSAGCWSSYSEVCATRVRKLTGGQVPSDHRERGADRRVRLALTAQQPRGALGAPVQMHAGFCHPVPMRVDLIYVAVVPGVGLHLQNRPGWLSELPLEMAARQGSSREPTGQLTTCIVETFCSSMCVEICSSESTHCPPLDHCQALEPNGRSLLSRKPLAVGFSGSNLLRSNHICCGPQYRCIPASVRQCCRPLAMPTEAYWPSNTWIVDPGGSACSAPLQWLQKGTGQERRPDRDMHSVRMWFPMLLRTHRDECPGDQDRRVFV